MHKKKKLLILADSPGSADFIFPVIKLLSADFELKIATVKESPSKMLSVYCPFRTDTETEAEKVFELFEPDALLVGTSSLIDGPYVAGAITRKATLKKIPIICYQDYWANHRAPMNREVMDLWQMILAPDVLAEKFLREDGYKGEIAITGYPALEKFPITKFQQRRGAVRAEYGIADNAFLVLYAGAATPFGAAWDEITFNFFMSAVILQNKSPVVMVSPHPRDEDPSRYLRLATKNNAKIVLRRADEFSDDIIMGVDAVIGMYATPLIHACYLRIPAISIVLPDAGKARLQKIGLDDFPPNLLGATIGIYEPKPEKLAETLMHLQNNQEFKKSLRDAQERFLPHLEILSSQIVAEAVKNFLNKELT